jgi:hypothetical protein
VNFENLIDLAALQENPNRFLKAFAKKAVIDKVQNLREWRSSPRLWWPE